MVAPCTLPDGALLQRYHAMPGAYTDCLGVRISRPATLEDFVGAFYTTGLFKCERALLALIGRGGSDRDAKRLAMAEAQTFAAWTVEARSENQILLCDFAGATRSWLMVESAADPAGGALLLFGSAVVPHQKDRAGVSRLGLGFDLMLHFHKPYARALLKAAASRLSRTRA
jgi:hypothetical protein